MKLTLGITSALLLVVLVWLQLPAATKRQAGAGGIVEYEYPMTQGNGVYLPDRTVQSDEKLGTTLKQLGETDLTGDDALDARHSTQNNASTWSTKLANGFDEPRATAEEAHELENKPGLEIITFRRVKQK